VRSQSTEEPFPLDGAPNRSKSRVAATVKQERLACSEISDSGPEIPNLLIEPSTAHIPFCDRRQFLLKRMQGLRNALQVICNSQGRSFTKVEGRNHGKCLPDISSFNDELGSVLTDLRRAVDLNGVNNWLERGDQSGKYAGTMSRFHSRCSTGLVQGDKHSCCGGESGNRVPVKKVGEVGPPVPPWPKPIPHLHSAPPEAQPPYAIGTTQ
jgi:hypothetical protein